MDRRNTVADIFRRTASPFWLDTTKFTLTVPDRAPVLEALPCPIADGG